jgi:hypothetical protein
MKYFIVGLHASGKQEVADMLKGLGVKCGKLFSDVESASEELYNSYNYELFTQQDVNEVFENNAYIFIQELQTDPTMFHSYRIYEGLTKYEFDQNDVFVLSPDQVVSIPQTTIKEKICFIWLDNTKPNRNSRYHAEKRQYNFNYRDAIERKDIDMFVKTLYSLDNSKVLYFTNEEPSRVATIIYTLINHPELLELYAQNFN